MPAAPAAKLSLAPQSAEAARAPAAAASAPPRPAALAREIASGQLEALSAAELLRWALHNFHPRLALACSFGNPEGLVLLHMLRQLQPAARVYMLDSGRLPQETHDLADRIREQYAMPIEVVMPEAEAVQNMVRRYGQNLFYESLEKRQLCCRLRKVEPNRRYLRELDAYITGLRRAQNITRAGTRKVELEDGGRLVKVNPLADWRREQVMDYAAAHEIPLNRLHKQGYPTVGCAPCTRAIAPGAPLRSGRWWWENAEDKECGLHPNSGRQSQGSGI